MGAGAVVVEPEGGKTYVSTEQTDWVNAGTSTIVVSNPNVNSILSAGGFAVDANMYVGTATDQGSDNGDLYILDTVKNPFTIMSGGDVSVGAMLQVLAGKSLAFEASGNPYDLTVGSGGLNEGLVVGTSTQSAALSVNGINALTVNGGLSVFGDFDANVASVNFGAVNVGYGAIDVIAAGDVSISGLVVSGGASANVDAGGDVNMAGTVQNLSGKMSLDAGGDILVDGSLENSGASMQVEGSSVTVSGTMKNDDANGDLTIVADELTVSGGDADSYSFVNNGNFVADVTGTTTFAYGINLSGMGTENIFNLDTGALSFGAGADSAQWFAAFANRLNDFSLVVRQGSIDMSTYQSGLLNGADGNKNANMLVGAKNLSFSNVRNEGAVLKLLAGTDLVADASGVNAVGEPAEEIGNIIITNQLVGASGATTNVIASDTLGVGGAVVNAGNMNLNANNVELASVSNSGAGTQLNISSLTEQSGKISVQSNVVNSDGLITLSAKDISVGGALINNSGVLNVAGSDTSGGAIQIGQINAVGVVVNVDALAGGVNVSGAVTVSGGALNTGTSLTDFYVGDSVQISGDFTASSVNATGGGDVNIAASGADVFTMTADAVLVGGNITIDDANVIRHVRFDTPLVNVDGNIDVQNKGMLTMGLDATNYSKVGGVLNVANGGTFETYGYNLYVGSMTGNGKFTIHSSSVMADKGGISIDGNLYFDAENDVVNPSSGLIVKSGDSFSVETKADGADISFGAVSVGNGNNFVLKSADDITVGGVLGNNGNTTLNAKNIVSVDQKTTNAGILNVSGASVGMAGITNTGDVEIVAENGAVTLGDVETSSQLDVTATTDINAGLIKQTDGAMTLSAGTINGQIMQISGDNSVADVVANIVDFSGNVSVAGSISQGGAGAMLDMNVSEFAAENLSVGGDFDAVSGNTKYTLATNASITGDMNIVKGATTTISAGNIISGTNVTNAGILTLYSAYGLEFDNLVNDNGVMYLDSGDGVLSFDTLTMNSGNLIFDGREMTTDSIIDTGAMLYQSYANELNDRDINIISDEYEMTMGGLVVSGINQSGKLVVNTSDIDVGGDIVASDLRFVANPVDNWMNVNVAGNVSGGVDFIGLEKMTIGGNYTFDKNSMLNVAILPYQSGTMDTTDINYWASVDASDTNPLGQIVNPEGDDARALITVDGVFQAGTEYSDDAFSLNNTVSALKDGQVGITLRDTVDQGTAIWLLHADGGVENFVLSEQIRNLNVNFCNADGSICYNYLESLVKNTGADNDLPAYLSVRDLDGDGVAHDVYVVFDPNYGGPVLLNNFKIQPIVGLDANHTDGEFVSAGALDDLLIGQARNKQFLNGVPMEVIPLVFQGTNMEQMANELYNRMEYYVQTSNGASLAPFSSLFQVREIEQVAGAISLNEHTNFRSFEDRMFDEFIWNRNRNLKKAWMDVDYGMFYQNIDDGKHTDGNRFSIAGGFDWQQSNTLILGLTGRVSHSSSSAFDAMDLGYLPGQTVDGRMDVDVTDTDIGLGAYLMKTLGEKVRLYGNAFLDVHVFDINRIQNFVDDIDGKGSAVSVISEWGLMHDILNQYIVGNAYARAGYNFGFNITEQVAGDDYMKLQSDGYLILTPGYSLIAQKRIYPSAWFQIRPYMSIGVEYDVLGAPDKAEYRFAPSLGFTQYEIDIDPMWANIGGGIEMLSANGVQFGVDYRYQYNDAIQLHNIRMSGSYRF